MTDTSVAENDAANQDAIAAKAADDAKAAEAKDDANAAKDDAKPVPNWREGITDPKHLEFANRFNTPADMTKSALDLRQQLSRAVVLPGKDATEEQIAEFHGKLGVPKEATGYEVNLPENLPEGLEIDDAATARVEALKVAMHKANAPPSAVQAAVDSYFEMLFEVYTKREESFAEFQKQSEAVLRNEWKSDYDQNLTFATRAVAEFGGEDATAIMNNATADGMQIGNHPAMARMFAKIGRAMSSDTLHLGLNEDEKKGAKGRIDEIHALQYGSAEEKLRYKSDPVQAELQDLYQKTTGGGPIVGGAGRSL